MKKKISWTKIATGKTSTSGMLNIPSREWHEGKYYLIKKGTVIKITVEWEVKP